MSDESVEVEPLPVDVARQAGHHPRQGRDVALRPGAERDVVVLHCEQLPGIQTVLYPELVDKLPVLLLGLPAPDLGHDEEVEDAGEVRVHDVSSGFCDPVSQVLARLEYFSIIMGRVISIYLSELVVKS